ncbi:type II toxin-antitoxin system RelE/ParE family toxin [Effusibacillus lacus]|uniref:Translation repressor RelE n=1 Tax=Effusibacillus lacus TaxID=1348429 RepID=A0A292YP51_9BACL|nr:type II toxin-antitoxin system RelE/ParE family toxin [Effusibacillus lacus]TCS72275.1 toxin ParE1/3/4 [Effusibacillus lacus]GAX90250.1 translation repressor RelE [Effusibacillus lacus]
MPQRNKIKYTPAAVDDMDEIFSFISQDNVYAAEIMLEKLNDQIGKFAEFPNLGSVLSDEEYTLVERGYRFIVVHPYLVFYRLLDKNVIIHRILHARRDYLRELFTTQD